MNPIIRDIEKIIRTLLRLNEKLALTSEDIIELGYGLELMLNPDKYDNRKSVDVYFYFRDGQNQESSTINIYKDHVHFFYDCYYYTGNSLVNRNYISVNSNEKSIKTKQSDIQKGCSNVMDLILNEKMKKRDALKPIPQGYSMGIFSFIKNLSIKP